MYVLRMRNTANESPQLADIPLWRLLVYLDDIERSIGAESESAQLLAAEIQRRLRSGHHVNGSAKRKGAIHAR